VNLFLSRLGHTIRGYQINRFFNWDCKPYNWQFAYLSARNFCSPFVPYLWQLFLNRVQSVFTAFLHGMKLYKLDFLNSLDHHNTMEEERKSSWPKYAAYTLIVIVILLLILILFLYLIRSPLIFRSGAASFTTSSLTPVVSSGLSLDNSYIFASPLRAKTGSEKIRVTVFILDEHGLGISGKNVSITGGDLLQVTPIQPTTDSQGRATFDIASATSPGTFVIQASTGGVTLTQKATISFD